MTLRSQIAAAVDLAFATDYFGETVVYNGVPLDAIFRPLDDPKDGRSGASAFAELQVRVADVSAWSVNDQVEIGSDTWSVKKSREGSTWYKHVLLVERDRRLKP